ncbi:hypothetical protein BJ508DRAFT_320807 [Ascobolus immersus RN42]|uniref:T6SS Phospholipase effector Tle1-like catalytic domain-containing protein n=1 Tax=Ascobolus immersus RN42 TaxID=1160509 RepID=A0A3N4ISW1_ASCIM|nr:hypothetical protein BJ508DRAFT_320807 [Ascobolus immersus RN42]
MSEQKRLILLCDGTGNSASRRNERSTNVKRMLDILTPTYEGVKSLCTDPENHVKKLNLRSCKVCPITTFTGQQVVYYQSGVGTSTDMGDFSLNYAKGTGSGINDNILDAYNWLANNYQDGDEIFIFGFSRGAFTARVVANLVIQLGLFWKNRMYMLAKAWAQYTKDVQENWNYFVKQLWDKHYQFTRPVSIRVLGVWDTVGAVGVPDYMPTWMNTHKFHQANVLNGIDFVFHALAIDEYRRTFGPTLFYLPKHLDSTNRRTYPNSYTGVLEPFPDIDTVLKQCWFSGSHSNVGGSYPSEHIADITLAWMVDQCNIYGNVLSFDPMALYLIVERHRQPSKNILNLYKENPGKYPGYGCGSVYNSFKGNAFLTWQYRAPGLYSPGYQPGPAGVHPCTPTDADKIKWTDYDPSIISTYVEMIPKVKLPKESSFSNLTSSASWENGFHAVRRILPAFGNQQIQDEKERIAEGTASYKQMQEELILKKPETRLLLPLEASLVADDSPYDDPFKRKFCTNLECCHPARQGRYQRKKLLISSINKEIKPKEVLFPVLETDRIFATHETIHASVFARYRQHAIHTATEKAKQEKLDADMADFQNCKTYVPVSITDWNPGALKPFMYDEMDAPESLPKKPHTGDPDFTRYRRDEIFPGGPIIWTGRCPKSKLYFEILEEPDSLYEGLPSFEEICEVNNLKPGEDNRLYWSVKRLQIMVNNMILKLVSSLLPVQLKKVEDLTPEELKKRYMDALYLDDDFDVRYEPDMRYKREKHWEDIKDKEDGLRIAEALNWANQIEKAYKGRRFAAVY